MPLMPDSQPPEVLEPCEKPFNVPAAFMPPQLSSVLSLWLLPVAAARAGHLNALLFHEIIVETAAVMRFAADQFFRRPADEEIVKRSFRQLHLMRRSACKAGGGRSGAAEAGQASLSTARRSAAPIRCRSAPREDHGAGGRVNLF